MNFFITAKPKSKKQLMLLLMVWSSLIFPSAIAFHTTTTTTTKPTFQNSLPFSSINSRTLLRLISSSPSSSSSLRSSSLISASSSSSSSESEFEENSNDDNDNDNEDGRHHHQFHTKITSFADLGLNRQLLTAINAQPDGGWDHPTPVQELAIPQLLLLQNNDKEDEEGLPPASAGAATVVDAVWCEAPTGSGKTAAYVLPLLQNLITTTNNKQHGTINSSNSNRKIKSLIICPTRELADQIGTVVTNVAENISLKRQNKPTVLVLHGGVPLTPQINALADYCDNANGGGRSLDVLVATPGRLVDILTYYQNKDDAIDAALEKRLLDALDNQRHGKDSSSLSLEQLEQLKLDEILQNDNTDGRDTFVNLLENLQYLILDEADRLLGRAFESELNAVLDLLPTTTSNQISPLKTWMFSATFPKSIEPRLDHVLKRIGTQTAPIRIECTQSDRTSSSEIESISSSLQKKLSRTSTVSSASKLQSVGQSSSTIDMRAIRLEKRDRTQALRRLLEEYPDTFDRVLVFVATRYASEHVSRKLRRVGIESMELHGKLDQDARVRRLQDLKKGKIRVLLTTDIASRGLDIVGLPLVVNYDLPRSTSDFVHRCGRTGRAGKHGTAITFVTADSESHMEMIEKRHLVKPIEREILVGFEPHEEKWKIESEGSKTSIPGVVHSNKGLTHDRMFGGIKGRRKSKKDRLREAAAFKNAAANGGGGSSS